jgi:hypothetical protein
MEAKIKHFIKLLKLKKDLAKQVKENQTAINWVEPEIRNYFGDQGIDRMTQDGMTIFIKRDLFAAIKNDQDGHPYSADECVEALKLAGLGLYCEEKVKISGLTSYFRELDDDEVDMPDSLREKFEVKEVFKMASRKAN